MSKAYSYNVTIKGLTLKFGDYNSVTTWVQENKKTIGTKTITVTAEPRTTESKTTNKKVGRPIGSKNKKRAGTVTNNIVTN